MTLLNLGYWGSLTDKAHTHIFNRNAQQPILMYFNPTGHSCLFLFALFYILTQIEI